MAYMLNHEVGLHFKKGRFLSAFERGDLILLDEVNLANEEMLGVLYQLLTLGYVEFNGKEVEPEKGKKARVLATANPSSYAGRNRMSEAFMNRFEIIHVDEMNPDEMSDILIGKMKMELLLSGAYTRETLEAAKGEDPEAYLIRLNIILQKEYGVRRDELALIADVQNRLNSILESGSFLRMGSDNYYAFTLRNLDRIWGDVKERKASGINISLETWIREAYAEYAGVLVRMNQYLPVIATAQKEGDAAKGEAKTAPEETKDKSEDEEKIPQTLFEDPDYGTIKNIFATVMGPLYAKGTGKNQHEAFDDLILKNFSHIDSQYDEKNHSIRLDGILTQGEAPKEDVPIEMLIDVESTKFIQVQILKGLRRNIPTLLVGQSGGGKTEDIGDMAHRLGKKYVTVSLGDATLESLLGTMEYDRRQHRWVYRPGVLVKAMQEGAVLVLEEINMAKSGILEILNEYFDEKTLTNPFTLKTVNVHEDFRLFATMNPLQGQMGENTGRVTLSPALRNRFREVWVPHEKSDAEMDLILKGRFIQNGVKNVSEKARSKIISFFKQYQRAFKDSVEPVYYTSLRDVNRLIRIMSYLMTEMEMKEDDALARAIHRIYYLRMQNEETRNKVEVLLKGLQIKPYKPGPLRYEKKDHHLYVYEDRTAVAKFDLSQIASQLRTVIEKELAESQADRNPAGAARLAEERLQQEIQQANLVETDRTKRNLLHLLEALALPDAQVKEGRFNPVFLLGETAGGKSSLARYLTVSLLGQGYTRIQMNERSDELDWFGTYEPRELTMSLDRAYRIVTAAMERGEWVKIKKALSLWKKGSLSGQDESESEIFEKVAERIRLVDQKASAQITEIVQKALKEDWLEDSGEKQNAGRALKTIAYLIENHMMNVELEFREGRLLSGIKRGDTVVLDEINLASEEALAVLYQLLTLGYIEYYNKDAYPPRIEKIKPKQGFKLIATANPASYAGRNRLSEALMNRFEIQNIANMTSEEMAEVAVRENKKKEVYERDGKFEMAALKLAKLQREINKRLQEGGALASVGADQTQGYLFTLRNLKRIIRSVDMLLTSGNSSPPSELLVREAYLEYLGILGRSEEAVKLLQSLFSEPEFFPHFNPKIQITFQEEKFSSDLQIPAAEEKFSDPKSGLNVGGITIAKRYYPDEPGGISRDANVIEELEEGELTNLIRYAIVKGLLDPKNSTLLIGQSGGGKTETIGDLARRLGWRYRSVSLGNASLESLVGSYVMDSETKKFRYLMGILIQAMQEGAVLVLEEMNMAPSGLLELLNEYFDESTFTNPMTGEMMSVKNGKIHPNFRLFGTMNPEMGETGVSTGRVGLSPALRSRFTEVWVPHVKSPEETKRIITKKFKNRGLNQVSQKTISEIYYVYDLYRRYYFEERKIGQDNDEGYYTGIRDLAKIVDLMAQDMQQGVNEREALRFALKRVYYLRLHTEADRKIAREEILKGFEMTTPEYGWKDAGNHYEVKRGKLVIASVPKKILEEKKFILTPQSTELLGTLLEGMQRSVEIHGKQAARAFNPLMLFGETSGGKSTLAEIAAYVFGRKLTRIQMNQRTDEYDLMGSYHPVEVKLTFEQAYEVVEEAVRNKRVSRIEQALRALKITESNMRAVLGIPAKRKVSLQDIALNYLENYILSSARERNQTAIERMKKLATLLVNGVAGIELEFKNGMLLEAMGDREKNKSGHIVLLDEFNLAGEEAIGILYQLLTLGYVEFQGRKIVPGEGFQLVVSGNPSTYSGRNRMSEAFMNRFEIYHVPEMTQEEMARILTKKFDLKSLGIPEGDIKGLIEIQSELSEMSQNRLLDEFNLDNSYRFALRNLERIMNDVKERVPIEKDKSGRDILREEAYREYAGLLSQTTGEDHPEENNLRKVAAFFEKHLNGKIAEDFFYNNYRVQTEKEGQHEFLTLQGVKVRKLAPSEMLENLHSDLNHQIRSGNFVSEDGDRLEALGKETRDAISRRAERKIEKGDSRNPKDIVREEANSEYLKLLSEVPKIEDELNKLIAKHFYTQAERIEPLIELKSTALVRSQILKGFRDGGLIQTIDSQGQPVSVHRSQPVLLVGQSGGGKTEMIANEARQLNWAYLSVALGAATVESLIGTFILNDETGTFEFRRGVLVRAMEEGYAIVLEELNMAESGVIEVLNEYFDRGTMTIQERNVPVKIHPNFRLFATMNPTEGRTGRNAGRIPLSPALRSRFREVWVRSERTKGEQYHMILGGIQSLVQQVIEKGLPKEDEESYAPLEGDYYARRMAEVVGKKASKSVSMAFTPSPFSSPPERGRGEGEGALSMERVQMAAPADMPKKPAKKEWEKKAFEERKQIFEEQFRIVSDGRMDIEASDVQSPDEPHWAFRPSTNTLIYNVEEIMTLSLDALLGVAIHESMHRLVTRYLVAFSEFIKGDHLAARIFNILEDGRIENWARQIYLGSEEPLKATNDEIIFKFKDEDEMVERMIKTQEDGAEIPHHAAIGNFFLYLAKKGSGPDTHKVIEKMLKAMEERNPELRRDVERLMKAGYFAGEINENPGPDVKSWLKSGSFGGGKSYEDYVEREKKGLAPGVFNAVPVTPDEEGRLRVEKYPSEEVIMQWAFHQGIIIRDLIMPTVYKWAVKGLEDGSGKGRGKGKGKGKGKEKSSGQKAEGEADGDAEADASKDGEPVSPKDWKKMYDSLSPEDKKKILKPMDDLKKKAQDRTAKDSEDFKNAQTQAAIMEPISERDRLMTLMGKMINELTGYLRDLIQNTMRPKEITGLKKGRIDIRRLMQALARGFTDMRFYKQRVIPQKKNVKFTLVIDESGSMSGMEEKGKTVNVNTAAKGYRTLMGATLFMEVLESLGIDFAVRGYHDTTHLHKAFKGQKIEPSDRRSKPPTVPDRYSSRKEREAVIDDLYESIGQGSNNEGPALEAVRRDIKKAGGDKHFVIVITDGMGAIDDIKRILEEVRSNRGMIGGTHTEFIAIGLGNDTEIVPEVYGSKYSFHLKDNEMHKLPSEIKKLLQNIIRGVYAPEAGSGSRFERVGRLSQARSEVRGSFSVKIASRLLETLTTSKSRFIPAFWITGWLLKTVVRWAPKEALPDIAKKIVKFIQQTQEPEELPGRWEHISRSPFTTFHHAAVLSHDYMESVMVQSISHASLYVEEIRSRILIEVIKRLHEKDLLPVSEFLSDHLVGPLGHYYYSTVGVPLALALLRESGIRNETSNNLVNALRSIFVLGAPGFGMLSGAPATVIPIATPKDHWKFFFPGPNRRTFEMVRALLQDQTRAEEAVVEELTRLRTHILADYQRSKNDGAGQEKSEPEAPQAPNQDELWHSGRARSEVRADYAEKSQVKTILELAAAGKIQPDPFAEQLTRLGQQVAEDNFYAFAEDVLTAWLPITSRQTQELNAVYASAMEAALMRRLPEIPEKDLPRLTTALVYAWDQVEREMIGHYGIQWEEGMNRRFHRQRLLIMIKKILVQISAKKSLFQALLIIAETPPIYAANGEKPWPLDAGLDFGVNMIKARELPAILKNARAMIRKAEEQPEKSLKTFAALGVILGKLSGRASEKQRSVIVQHLSSIMKPLNDFSPDIYEVYTELRFARDVVSRAFYEIGMKTANPETFSAAFDQLIQINREIESKLNGWGSYYQEIHKNISTKLAILLLKESGIRASSIRQRQFELTDVFKVLQGKPPKAEVPLETRPLVVALRHLLTVSDVDATKLAGKGMLFSKLGRIDYVKEVLQNSNFTDEDAIKALNLYHDNIQAEYRRSKKTGAEQEKAKPETPQAPDQDELWHSGPARGEVRRDTEKRSEVRAGDLKKLQQLGRLAVKVAQTLDATDEASEKREKIARRINSLLETLQKSVTLVDALVELSEAFVNIEKSSGGADHSKGLLLEAISGLMLRLRLRKDLPERVEIPAEHRDALMEKLIEMLRQKTFYKSELIFEISGRIVSVIPDRQRTDLWDAVLAYVEAGNDFSTHMRNLILELADHAAPHDLSALAVRFNRYITREHAVPSPYLGPIFKKLAEKIRDQRTLVLVSETFLHYFENKKERNIKAGDSADVAAIAKLAEWIAPQKLSPLIEFMFNRFKEGKGKDDYNQVSAIAIMWIKESGRGFDLRSRTYDSLMDLLRFGSLEEGGGNIFWKNADRNYHIAKEILHNMDFSDEEAAERLKKFKQNMRADYARGKKAESVKPEQSQTPDKDELWHAGPARSEMRTEYSKQQEVKKLVSKMHHSYQMRGKFLDAKLAKITRRLVKIGEDLPAGEIPAISSQLIHYIEKQMRDSSFLVREWESRTFIVVCAVIEKLLPRMAKEQIPVIFDVLINIFVPLSDADALTPADHLRASVATFYEEWIDLADKMVRLLRITALQLPEDGISEAMDKLIVKLSETVKTENSTIANIMRSIWAYPLAALLLKESMVRNSSNKAHLDALANLLVAAPAEDWNAALFTLNTERNLKVVRDLLANPSLSDDDVTNALGTYQANLLADYVRSKKTGAEQEKAKPETPQAPEQDELWHTRPARGEVPSDAEKRSEIRAGDLKKLKQLDLLAVKLAQTLKATDEASEKREDIARRMNLLLESIENPRAVLKTIVVFANALADIQESSVGANASKEILLVTISDAIYAIASEERSLDAHLVRSLGSRSELLETTDILTKVSIEILEDSSFDKPRIIFEILKQISTMIDSRRLSELIDALISYVDSGNEFSPAVADLMAESIERLGPETLSRLATILHKRVTQNYPLPNNIDHVFEKMAIKANQPTLDFVFDTFLGYLKNKKKCLSLKKKVT